MLKRLYVDNYKCLVNFEYQPGKVQLIIGGNGTRKSSIFDVLSLLRTLTCRWCNHDAVVFRKVSDALARTKHANF